MSQHPLVTLSNDRDVKQAKGFRLAAEKLSGASLEADYQAEVASAPRRSAEGLAHLGIRVGRRAKQRQNGRDEKHLAEAIARGARAEGATPLELPSGDPLTIVDHCVPAGKHGYALLLSGGLEGNTEFEVEDTGDFCLDADDDDSAGSCSVTSVGRAAAPHVLALVMLAIGLVAARVGRER